MIMENIFLIISTIFTLLFILLFFSRQEFCKAFKGLDTIYLRYALMLSLAMFLLYFSFSRMYYFQEMAAANNEHFLKNYNYGPLFPYLVFLLMPFFDIQSGLAAASLLFALSCLGTFLLSYVIFRDNRASTATFLVYITASVLILLYMNSLTYFSSLMHFFIIYSTIFILVSYEAGSRKTYTLALVFILLAGLSRFELMSLIYIFFIGFLLFRRRDSGIRPLLGRMAMPLMVFLLISPIYILTLNYSVNRCSGGLLEPADRIMYQSVVWPSIKYFSLDYFPKAAAGFLCLLTSPLIIAATAISITSLLLMKQKQRRCIILLFLCSLVLLLPYLFCSTCFDPRYLFYIMLPPFFAIGYLVSTKLPWRGNTQTSSTLKHVLLIPTIIVISVLLVRAASAAPRAASNEELEISEIIRQESRQINTTPHIIVSRNVGYRMDFLINTHTLLLHDIIRSTNIYKEMVDKTENALTIRVSSYAALFYNKTLMERAISEEEIIFSETAEEIQKEYERGRDPLGVRQTKNTYFFQYPGCIKGDTKPCSIITRNFETTKLYERNGFVLYRIDDNG
jgi:hypothetical protein